ncbi:MAG: DNA ligase D [Acidobacteriota bacterium]
MPPHRNPLDAYRAKRSAGATPEPFGGPEDARPGLFVVQQHAARKMHYDLRLEIGGVLKSWAVPKGPSLSTDDKRLAVQTEDHPAGYGDFEGLIPQDNYGAGAMIVWDRGLTVHHLDPQEGLESGKLLFELRGFKLRGLWTLVKTSRSPKEWLLIKKPDAWSTGEGAEDLPAESVLSGLTVEELRDGSDRAERIRDQLDDMGALRGTVELESLSPMLADPHRDPFSAPGWWFELKYDGFRVLAATRRGEAPRLRYRSGRDASRTYPELTRALAALPYRSLILDGEVVILDDEARPSFQRLQQRGQMTRRPDVERAAVRDPTIFYAFDLVAFEGFDLRSLALRQRKALLKEVLPAAGPLRFTDHVEEQGEALWQAVRAMGLEGLIGKRADSHYQSRRSPDWVKIRADLEGEFVVVGFTAPKGSRSGFGALHLGVLEGASMVFVGSVGTGFDQRTIDQLHAELSADQRSDPPLTGGAIPTGEEHTWVEPRRVAAVRYTELTDSGQLRHPVFLGLKGDKLPEDCSRAPTGSRLEEPLKGATEDDEVEKPKVPFSNLDKVFWPAEGYTKGDLIDYYRAVSPRLLPFLQGRPVVLDRFPDGIEGKSFFQKNAPDFTPDWVRTAPLWSEETGRETSFFAADDETSLLYLINLGAIPLHIWSSRMATLQSPDWCILDLDAKDASFEQAIEVARCIHRLCEGIDLPSYVKTSGATGLHVLIPLGRQVTFEQSRQLAEVLAKVVAEKLPEIASVARRPAARQGKIYVDFLQNGYGKLLVAPYSARPQPGATVSMPLAWDEVRPGLDPAAFDLRTAPPRLAAEDDPFARLMNAAPDLMTALGRLAERL